MVLEFTLLPPEVNSGLIFGGAGAGPMLAAASAWAELASELSTSASSFDSVISALTSGQWTGPSADLMAQAAAPYLQWLTAAVGHAEGSAAQAHAAAAAFEAALAATVHPAAVATNRLTLMTLIATNILGQNTAAIFATEIEYMEMWAQDVAAMFGYHAGASSVAAAMPTIIVPPGSLAGLVSTPLTNVLSSLGTSLASGFSSFVGAAESAIAQVSTLFSAVPASVTSLASVAQIGMAPAGAAVVSPMMVLAHGTAPASSVAGTAQVLADAPALGGSTAPPMQVLGSSGGFGTAMSAGLGTARFVGSISVPPAWQGSLPARIVTAAMTGVEGAAPGLPAATSGPTGVPMVSSQSASATKPGMPGAAPGSGGPRAKHVVQSRPRVVPRTEVG
jgi:PPE-repeat protein